MKRLKDLDKKIADLKQKKAEFERKAALQLFKKLKTILGPDFSPEIVVRMITHTWENESSKMKEVWLQKAHSFRISQDAQQQDESPTTND